MTLLMVIALVSGLLAVYPYVLYPLTLWLLPRRSIRRSENKPIESMSLLFCAYNEARSLPAKLENISALKRRHPSLEVLVYDDGSSDQTTEILKKHSELITTIRGLGRKGKAHGMKQLAARASGDVLICTDANVILGEDALENLVPYYGDPDIGGVLGSLRYVNAGESPTAMVGSLYWRLEEALKDLESETGSVAGADGSIFSIRRELYPNFPDTVLDDLTVSMSVIFAGSRLLKAHDVIAYEQAVTRRSDEIRRKMRIAARAYHTHRFIRSSFSKMHALDIFKYYSHKYLRWFGGLFFLSFLSSGLILAAAFSQAVAAAIACALILLITVGVRLEKGPLAAAIDAGAAVLATQLGVARAMFGEVVVTWNPAVSR